MTITTKELTKKDLGQYFTPAVVVDFALEMARAIAGPSLGKGARVIDPACGGGAFLITALEKGIGSAATVFGVDIDPNVREEWVRNELAVELGRNLYIGNGLYDTNDNRVSEKLPLRQFDLVVGNPPYGGLGVRGVEKDQKLLNALKTYELWRLGQVVDNDEDQGNLFGEDVLERLRRLQPEEVKRLERFPVEVLFVERFVRLARPGGVIAVVIPDGILANVKLDYVRNWLAERCHVVAVVSLPRGTFREAGTTAKTSLLFLRKKGERTRGPKHVFMAQLDEGKNGGPPDAEEFDFVFNKFRERFKGYGANSPVIWTSTTTDDIWNNRWDAYYWDPTFTEPIKKLSKNHETVVFKEICVEAVSGYRGKTEFAKKGVRAVEVRCIRPFGVDFGDGRYVVKGGAFDKPQYYVGEGDILIVRSGVASAGRIIAVPFIQERAVICGDIFKVRLSEMCLPGYFTLLMKSRVGELQIERVKAGIASTKLDVMDINSFIVPLATNKFQTKIDRIYNDIYKSYSEAMKIKYTSRDEEYEEKVNYKKHMNHASSTSEEGIAKVNEYFFGKGD